MRRILITKYVTTRIYLAGQPRVKIGAIPVVVNSWSFVKRMLMGYMSGQRITMLLESIGNEGFTDGHTLLRIKPV